jgi:hypothetical protein
MVTKRSVANPAIVGRPATPAGGFRRRRTHIALLLGGIAAAGALVLGAVTLGSDDPSSSAGLRPQAVSARATSAVDGLIVYIVADQAQAEQVLAATLDLARVWLAGGQEPVMADIVIAGSPTEDAALQAYRDANDIRRAQGLRLIPIRDLTRP